MQITDDGNTDLWKGCDCADDPDWSQQPPPQVRKDYRHNIRALRNRHMLPREPSEEDYNAIAASPSAIVSTRLPLATFGMAQGFC